MPQPTDDLEVGVLELASRDLEHWARYMRYVSLATASVAVGLAVVIFVLHVYDWPATRIPITSATDLWMLFFAAFAMEWLRKLTFAVFVRPVE